MKLKDIFALFTLCVIVKGAWFSAAVQPVILGFGAVLSAINSDVLDVQLFEGKNSWLPFINKQDKTEPVVEIVDDEKSTEGSKKDVELTD